MQKFCLWLVACLACTSAFGVVTTEYEYLGGEYPNGDANLWCCHVTGTDLIQGQIASLDAGGFHPVTVGGLSNLTDGAWSSNGWTVIAADNAYPGISLEVTYTLADVNISEIHIFAGHDGDGSRGWITVEVEVDTGSGFTLLSDATTGAFGQSPAAAVSTGLRIYDDASSRLATGVDFVRFTFHCVSHSSTHTYKDWDDNSPPENNYPNQGTILKEIDILEDLVDVDGWELY